MAGKNVMTVHVGTDEYDVDRKVWEIPDPLDVPWSHLNRRTPPSVSAYWVTFQTVS